MAKCNAERRRTVLSGLSARSAAVQKIKMDKEAVGRCPTASFARLRHAASLTGYATIMATELFQLRKSTFVFASVLLCNGRPLLEREIRRRPRRFRCAKEDARLAGSPLQIGADQNDLDLISKQVLSKMDKININILFI
ncbi:hypothetical protein [Paenibacillus sp. sgz302251]|uniref:hypothetical protein n=1 Tax=Paenibacillus sp. sgz302251 TaxID=3414493 RepID=UPI003C79C08D